MVQEFEWTYDSKTDTINTSYSEKICPHDWKYQRENYYPEIICHSFGKQLFSI